MQGKGGSYDRSAAFHRRNWHRAGVCDRAFLGSLDLPHGKRGANKMAAWTVYFIVYLCGVATPVLIVRNLLKNSEDGSSCLLDMILWSLVSLALLVLWLELSN